MALMETLAIASLIGGQAGQFASWLGGKNQQFDISSIESLINKMRQRGARQIGGRVSRAKVKAGQTLASQGFGDSTLLSDEIRGLEGMGLGAIADLEASLGAEELRLIESLSGLQQRESMFKRQQLSDIFGGIADIGATYLLGQYFPETEISFDDPFQEFMPTNIDDLISSQETIYSPQLIS